MCEFLLQQSIENKKKIVFFYASASGALTRKVKPFLLARDKNDVLHLIGFQENENKTGIRDFKVERMSNVVMLDESFEVDKIYPINKKWKEVLFSIKG